MDFFLIAISSSISNAIVHFLSMIKQQVKMEGGGKLTEATIHEAGK